MRGTLQLLTTKSHIEYAKNVFDELCLFPEFYEHYQSAPPYAIETKSFADGEIEAYITITLKGKDVVLFASSGRSYAEQDPAKAKLTLYHTIDAIKRSQPNRLTIFEPYCSPSRSDRSLGRNSVGLWVHYKTLISLGVNKIITYQLHSDKTKSMVDPTLCAMEDIPGTLQLMEYIAMHFIKEKDYYNEYVQEHWLFCSVDAGGEGFARKFSKAFHTGLITAYKQRDYTKENTVESINILTATDLTDKVIWIVDDMIDTAGSVESLIRTLEHHKVKEVNLAVVHPVFSRPSLEKLNILYKQGLLNKVLVMDTIPHAPEYSKPYPFLEIVPSTQLTAQIVMRIHEDNSLSPFFEEFNIEKFLSNLKYRQ